MPGVRHGWRDSGIAPGRGDALFRERVVVVGVNDEMRDARMLRVLSYSFSRMATDLSWLA